MQPPRRSPHEDARHSKVALPASIVWHARAKLAESSFQRRRRMSPGPDAPQVQSNLRNPSASIPMIATMFRRVALGSSRPAWTGTTTVRSAAWRITRRLGSTSAHPEARPRQTALPAHPAGRQPRLPRSDRRLPPRPPAQLCGGAPDAVLVLFNDVRHMDYAGHNADSPIPGARHGSARWSYSAGTEQSPTRSCELVRFQAASLTGPVSARRRRRSLGNGDAQWPNLGHIRVLQGIESDNRRPEEHSI